MNKLTSLIGALLLVCALFLTALNVTTVDASGAVQCQKCSDIGCSGGDAFCGEAFCTNGDVIRCNYYGNPKPSGIR